MQACNHVSYYSEVIVGVSFRTFIGIYQLAIKRVRNLTDKPELSANPDTAIELYALRIILPLFSDMVYRILVGSYNDEIYTLTFDPVVPSVEVSLSVTVGHHPSWVTKHPSDPFVIYTGVEQSDGRIVTLKYDTEGRGTILQNISSGGDSPCTLIALEDQLVVGNVSTCCGPCD